MCNCVYNCVYNCAHDCVIIVLQLGVQCTSLDADVDVDV